MRRIVRHSPCDRTYPLETSGCATVAGMISRKGMTRLLTSLTRDPEDPLRALTLAISLLLVAGCAGRSGGSREARAPAARAADAVARELWSSPCASVAITADDPGVRLAGWLGAVADTTVALLRARGVRAYRTRSAALDDAWIALTRSSTGERMRVERRHANGPERLARIDVPRDVDVAPITPESYAGRRAVTGSTYPWPTRAMWATGPGTIWAESETGARALELSLRDGAIEVHIADRAAHARAGPARTPVPGGHAFLLDDAPAPLRDVPLVGIAHPPRVRETFVALDAWGTLLYGDARGLLAAPRHGHGKGIVHLDAPDVEGGVYVTGTDEEAGQSPKLVWLTARRSRGLVQRATRVLPGEPIVAMVATDVDGDGWDDLVLARDVVGGTRFDALVSTPGLVPAPGARTGVVP